MKLYPIETGSLKLDGGAMFGVVPKVLWQKKYPANENNLATWAMRCLLIDDGNNKVLVDTGMGDKQDEKFFSYYSPSNKPTLEESLNKLDYQLADITHVILTHLHFDHAGGAIRYNENKELVPTFPNATYFVGKRHWNWSIDPNSREKASFLEENILPIRDSGNLILVEKEGEILPNIEVRFFEGHTEGQLIPMIHTPEGKTVVYMADLLPSHVHVPMPWIMAYDIRPLVTLDDKERLFSEAVKNNYILFFEHDLYTECCTLKNTPKGARVDKLMMLKEAIG